MVSFLEHSIVNGNRHKHEEKNDYIAQRSLPVGWHEESNQSTGDLVKFVGDAN